LQDASTKRRMLWAIRREQRFYASPNYARLDMFRERERAFLAAFWPRLVAAMEVSGSLPRRVLRELGAAALSPGYKLPDVTKRRGVLTRKADELLRLPRIQQALSDKFDSAGFTLDRTTEIMASIAERSASDTDRLRACDMRIRMTIGYAPTKSASLQMHGRADQFYQKDEFEKNPGITLDAEE